MPRKDCTPLALICSIMGRTLAANASAAATLFLDSTSERVADASDTSSNSALTGLSSIAGRLFLRNGVAINPSGNLTVSGELHVDDGGSGGTTFSIPGTLTNSNFVGVGNGSISAPSTVMAAALNNAGTINLTGNGGNVASLNVNGSATNDGTINLGSSSDLAITGACSGDGSINLFGNAQLELRSPPSAQGPFHSGAAGSLELYTPQDFHGTVAGLTAQDVFDLRDINFATVQTPTYSGNSSGGPLTVTDGTRTANIALLGNYLASAFTPSSDS